MRDEAPISAPLVGRLFAHLREDPSASPVEESIPEQQPQSPGA